MLTRPLTQPLTGPLVRGVGEGGVLPTVIAPAGFALLLDPDGAYLTDADGAYLMEHI